MLLSPSAVEGASKAAGELPSTLLTETPIHPADVEIVGVAKEVDSRLRVFCGEGKAEVVAKAGGNYTKPWQLHCYLLRKELR